MCNFFMLITELNLVASSDSPVERSTRVESVFVQYEIQSSISLLYFRNIYYLK